MSLKNLEKCDMKREKHDYSFCSVVNILTSDVKYGCCTTCILRWTRNLSVKHVAISKTEYNY